MELYADIIVDISHSELDRPFQYKVPEKLQESLEPGNVVEIPFGKGNRIQKGYVLKITQQLSCEPEKMKEILRIETDLVGENSRLTALALWMRDYYGSTAVQALRTVLPLRQKAAPKQKKKITLLLKKEDAAVLLEQFRSKNQKARARLLAALIEEETIPYEIVTGSLKITLPVIRALEEKKILALETKQVYRTPQLLEKLYQKAEGSGEKTADRERQVRCLNEDQQRAVRCVCENWEKTAGQSYLLYGVTGSGKTEVYMELIACALAHGQQAILLIPEISLTYQNVMRFYRRFGEKISVLHSRLSQGERYDRFERARNGEISIMIGPRSALFTPFPRLGIIIVDEEHESSYQSESVPRYHARETALRRGKLEKARVVLGSATPSLESFYQAKKGIHRLLSLPVRAAAGSMPEVTVTDMREELRNGNKSIFSRLLYEKIQRCLEKGEQAMLFLNRRGYSGFVACRACGHVIKCPHCDVALSEHKNEGLVCHYCGYHQPPVTRCPVCRSGFIGGFRAGTQQIEELVHQEFPGARVLRMDADTTRGKEGHAAILDAFSRKEADILIGTQMIVKGHDFPAVTLVGILAADLSLYVSDYRASERTFQLLTQAAGRAGRGKLPGEVVIQTYSPDHYAVEAAARQDYEEFYDREIAFRSLSGYPPCGELLEIHCTGSDLEGLETAVGYLGQFLRKAAIKYQACVLGPTDEAVARINDRYRKVLYVRHTDQKKLTALKNITEEYIEINTGFRTIGIQMERR